MSNIGQSSVPGGMGWLSLYRDAYLGELDKLGNAARTISRDVVAATPPTLQKIKLPDKICASRCRAINLVDCPSLGENPGRITYFARVSSECVFSRALSSIPMPSNWLRCSSPSFLTF